MNIYFLIAGIISAFACIGHFTIGRRDFLIPILKSDAEEIPKKVMHSLFHYMSVFQIISTVVFLRAAFDSCCLFENANDAILIIAINYTGFAISQFLIAVTSKVPKGISKMFQWVFWAVIALLSFLGIYKF